MHDQHTTELARRLARTFEAWTEETAAEIRASLDSFRYLDAAQMGEALNLPASSVKDQAILWERSGGKDGIPAVKIGRSWRFDPEVVRVVLRRRMGVSSLFEGDGAPARLSIVGEGGA